MDISEYKKFLLDNYKEEIINLLNDKSNHSSIIVNLKVLRVQNSKLYSEVINDVRNVTSKWGEALLIAQTEISNQDSFLTEEFSLKQNCHVRFANLPLTEDILCGAFPDNECIGLFVQIKGNIVQMSQEKILEIKREMICTKCNSTYIFEAQYGKMYKFDIPVHCLNIRGCKGILHPKNKLPKPQFCMDFQQIRLQEICPVGNEKNTSSLVICLENDLVNTCKPGECVTICGTVEVRWRFLKSGFRDFHILSLRANSILKENVKPNIAQDINEQIFCVRTQWQESVDNLGLIKTRDLLVDSICSEIMGLSFIKLGLVLALCAEFNIKKKTSNLKRNQSHVLLAGEAGTGKSKLLRAVHKAFIGSIITNGLGCSVAGLTAAAFKDGGEWNLQAGALVLADGGICCIDQFNLMKPHDKAAVHETMEQQTISIAKAGLVCKLQTQCAVLATANFKSNRKKNLNDLNTFDLDIGTPLLSRFDLIFFVNDNCEQSWDLEITNHLLKLTKSNNQSSRNHWNLQRLQSHFMAIRETNPKFSESARIILGSYYKFYRSNFDRDFSRSTVRMLDSINRLAQCHARLMFRNEVTGFDAVVIIQLLEGSWGFGKIIKFRKVDYNISLCTTDEIIVKILNTLGLSNLTSTVIVEKNYFYKEEQNNSSRSNKDFTFEQQKHDEINQKINDGKRNILTAEKKKSCNSNTNQENTKQLDETSTNKSLFKKQKHFKTLSFDDLEIESNLFPSKKTKHFDTFNNSNLNIKMHEEENTNLKLVLDDDTDKINILKKNKILEKTKKKSLIKSKKCNIQSKNDIYGKFFSSSQKSNLKSIFTIGKCGTENVELEIKSFCGNKEMENKPGISKLKEENVRFCFNSNASRELKNAMHDKKAKTKESTSNSLIRFKKCMAETNDLSFLDINF